MAYIISNSTVLATKDCLGQTVQFAKKSLPCQCQLGASMDFHSARQPDKWFVIHLLMIFLWRIKGVFLLLFIWRQLLIIPWGLFVGGAEALVVWPIVWLVVYTGQSKVMLVWACLTTHWAKQNQSFWMTWAWSHFELLHSYIHCFLKRRLLSHLIIRVWSSQSQPFAGKTCKTYMFCYCREHCIVWVSIDSFSSTAAAV